MIIIISLMCILFFCNQNQEEINGRWSQILTDRRKLVYLHLRKSNDYCFPQMAHRDAQRATESPTRNQSGSA